MLSKLAAWRSYRHLSLRGLAESSGVSARTIVAIEQGHVVSPHPRTQQRLAAALEATVEDLDVVPPIRQWTFCFPERQAEVIHQLARCGQGVNRDGTWRRDTSWDAKTAQALRELEPKAVEDLHFLIVRLTDLRTFLLEG